MAEAVEHRGPDSFGHHLSSGIGLGIRRLRVIDLITGDQPISNEDGSVWVILNGEIYNFLDLRSRLQAVGHTFATRSDTETIVHAYEEYGEDFVTHLSGMFALALWDDRRRRLVLARDRLGKKPLLYAQIGGDLVFGSEMQALIASAEVRLDVDLGAVGDYMAYGYVPTPTTILRGVKKLPPAHVLVWEEGRTSIRPYWQLSYGPKLQLTEAEAVGQLEALLDEAVRVRLIADVPIGALLSGGVDSSLVVSFMADHTSRVSTFSIGFDDPSHDELSYARRVAQRYGTDHHELIVRPDAAAVLPVLVRHYGEPYADSSAIPSFYVSKLAREHVTVALTGDGGDESFAGYDRYRGMTIARSLTALGLARPASVALAVSRRLPSRAGTERVERFLAGMKLPDAARYSSWVSVAGPDLWSRLIAPDATAGITAERSRRVERVFDEMASLGPVDRVLATDVQTYLLDDLLVKMDIASMANSLETRSPLLDHELVEFAARLPEHYKLGPRGEQKHLLRKLARTRIPHENIDRPKKGFAVPIARWLRQDIRELAEDALLGRSARSRGFFNAAIVQQLWTDHRSGKRDHSRPLWALIMFELWHREFIDGRVRAAAPVLASPLAS